MSEHKTDWQWCYENPKEAAAEIDRLQVMSDNYCALLMEANDKLAAQPSPEPLAASHSEDGREVPEVVGYGVPSAHFTRDGWEDGPDAVIGVELASEREKEIGYPLMTVAQHERIVAAKDAELRELRDSMAFRTSLIGRLEAERDELRAQPARQVGGDERGKFDSAYAEVVDNGWTNVKHMAWQIWQARAALAPAAVAVVIPAQCTDRNQHVKYRGGWNNCLSAIARLNRRAIPAGLLERTERHLANWLELNACECEGFHVCGRNEVKADRDELRALLGKEGE